MGSVVKTPLLEPNPGVSKFGQVVTAIRRKLFGATEVVPLELSFGSDAEARGYGNSPQPPDQGSLADWAFDRMRMEAGRFAAYKDYEIMDAEVPEVSAALDVISEFATQNDDPKSKTFDIECDEPDFQHYLMQKAEELDLTNLVTPTSRDIAKYGGMFWELVADDVSSGITKVKALPGGTMIRNETKYGDLMKEAFTQIDPKTNRTVARFASWQIVHGRYQKMTGRPYGNSLLESGRAVFKKLQMMEDGLVMGRLYRSHMRYVFQIPVDGMDANRADTYIQRKKREFRKKTRFDGQNQKVGSLDSPISPNEDFYIAIRKDSAEAKVDTVQGQSIDSLGDIEYFQNKLIIVIKVPKALLGLERDVNAKATLTQQDINFARTLRRNQQVTASMVKQALTIAMILDGINPDRVPNWAVKMPNVSTTDELRKWQVELLKAQVALVYGQKLPVVDTEYIWKQIMQISSDDFERLSKIDPAELGIQTMPSPPFENAGQFADMPDPNAGGDFGGGADSQQNLPPTREDIDLLPAVGDANIVLLIRSKLGLPTNEPVREEEIKVVQALRSFKETFGYGLIEAAAVREAMLKRR